MPRRQTAGMTVSAVRPPVPVLSGAGFAAARRGAAQVPNLGRSFARPPSRHSALSLVARRSLKEARDRDHATLTQKADVANLPPFGFTLLRLALLGQLLLNPIFFAAVFPPVRPVPALPAFLQFP
jgi:hypothetical protein